MAADHAAAVDREVDRRLWAALALVAGLATAARMHALGWPADAEELALAGPFSPSEWATNPPLLTWVYGALARPEDVVRVGRAASTLAAAAAVLGVGVAARRAGASRGAATLAGVALAILPAFNQQAALCRAYAPASALWAWHMVALAEAAKARRGAVVAWALSAALLPWLHYATAPGLCLELMLVGRAVPRRARAVVALSLGAALAALLVGVLWAGAHPPRDDDPARLWGLLRVGWSGTVVDGPWRGSVGVAALVLVLALLGARRVPPVTRRAALALVLGVVAVAWAARAREPVQVFWVVPCLVLVGAGWGGTARAALVVLALGTLGPTPRPSRYQQAAISLPTLVLDEQAVAISPDALWDMALFQATGDVPMGPSSAWTCPGAFPGVPCFSAYGRRFYRATDGLPEAGRWLAVAIDAPRPPARCGPAVPVPTDAVWVTAACPAP